jgi:hypothetical protein
VGWSHHIPSFVDPEDREPYWTRHHREIQEAQDDWAEEAAGAGVGEARPLISPSAVVEQPDLLAPARAGSQGDAGVRSRSHPPRSL